MKALRNLLIVGVLAFAMSSCASIGPYGSIYTKVTLPQAATSNTVGSKVGSAEAIGVLGLVGIGEAGIQQAAKDGGISKISHVDYEVTSILGLFSKYTVYVYGE